jgi:hypothetical protein
MAHDTGSRSAARLVHAYTETEDFARGLIARENERQARSRRSLWIGGLAVVMAAGFALPYLGVGASGPAPMTVAELDSLTPEQLAQLAPAAGGQSEPQSFVERLFGGLVN